MMWMIFPARFGESRDLDYLISNEKIKTDKPRIRLTSRNIFGHMFILKILIFSQFRAEIEPECFGLKLRNFRRMNRLVSSILMNYES